MPKKQIATHKRRHTRERHSVIRCISNNQTKRFVSKYICGFEIHKDKSVITPFTQVYTRDGQLSQSQQVCLFLSSARMDGAEILNGYANEPAIW